jgi:hypothetical protein
MASIPDPRAGNRRMERRLRLTALLTALITGSVHATVILALQLAFAASSSDSIRRIVALAVGFTVVAWIPLQWTVYSTMWVSMRRSRLRSVRRGTDPGWSGPGTTARIVVALSPVPSFIAIADAVATSGPELVLHRADPATGVILAETAMTLRESPGVAIISVRPGPRPGLATIHIRTRDLIGWGTGLGLHRARRRTQRFTALVATAAVPAWHQGRVPAP